MRKYHHVGIPTAEPKPNETYLPHLKIHVVAYDTNPYGIEWMRFDPDCAVPDLVRTVPHIAFEVDNLEAELAGKEVLIQPNSPSEGVIVAFIVDNGVPIEFLQYLPPLDQGTEADSHV